MAVASIEFTKTQLDTAYARIQSALFYSGTQLARNLLYGMGRDNFSNKRKTAVRALFTVAFSMLTYDSNGIRPYTSINHWTDEEVADIIKWINKNC